VLLFFLGWIDNGSPFFLQKRVGLKQKIFVLVKFRSMPINTLSLPTHELDEANISKYGKFIRSSKLDEIPQLINVLIGDMSFVGARPCLPEQDELIRYRHDFNIYKYRPGITGLAQIKKIDMSDPLKLAYIEKKMYQSLNIKQYFSYIFKTIFYLI